MELQKGHLLKDKYEIISKAGEGGYSKAYIARRIDDLQEVLIKQTRNSKRKTRNSFENEFDILQCLENLHAPECLELFAVDQHLYLALEYKKGRTFEELIFEDHHTYSEQQACTVMEGITQVLAPIHARGIVHRDLRIPNILLNGEKIHLIDFGLAAKIGDRQNFRFSRAKRRFRDNSFKSDFYALGHFFLFLLYSNFTPDGKKERPWEEELELTPNTRHILRRMLQLDSPYERIEELQMDFKNTK